MIPLVHVVIPEAESAGGLHAVVLGAEVRDPAGEHIDIHVVLGVVGVELNLEHFTTIVVAFVRFREGRVGGVHTGARQRRLLGLIQRERCVYCEGRRSEGQHHNHYQCGCNCFFHFSFLL